jgi:hypothetical protein
MWRDDGHTTHADARVGAALLIVAEAVTAVLLLSAGSSAGERTRLPLAVFVRPQTAADRTWWARERHGLLKGFGGPTAPASMRFAQRTPRGDPVFVLLQRGHTHGSCRSAARRPATPFWLAWSGEVSGAPLPDVSDDGYASTSSSGGDYYPPPGVTAPAAVTRMVVLVANGVARVRFAYPAGGPSTTVPVIGNTAAVQFREPCCVLEPEMTWYSSGGSVVGRHLLGTTSLSQMAPPAG